MSPTILRVKGYRFYFLSNEESRMHVHVACAEGEAKFWIEPIISLATYYRIKPKQLNEIQRILEKNKNEISKEWQNYFGKR